MRRFVYLLSAALIAATLGAAPVAAAGPAGGVFTMTNAVAGNEIVAWARAADGTLTPAGSVSTGGLGTGAGLGSQGAVTLSGDGHWLFAVNAGSDSVSTFRVAGTSLTLTDVEPSGGDMPTSVTSQGDLVYVLNAGGTGNIAGFRRHGAGDLTPIAGSSRPLSSPAAGAAQVGFSANGRTLVVTEKATSRVDVYPVLGDGVPGTPTVLVSPGTTPFGFAITRKGVLIVSEAVTGSASSYRLGPKGGISLVSAAVPTTELAACWFVATDAGRFAYTTNAASDSISGFRVDKDGAITLLDTDGVTADLGAGAHPTDEAIAGHYLYSLVAGGVAILRVEGDGSLTPAGSVGGPAGAAGLAAT